MQTVTASGTPGNPRSQRAGTKRTGTTFSAFYRAFFASAI
jgi:hypothetical protein